MADRIDVYKLLNDMGISYHEAAHKAVYSMQEMVEVGLDSYGMVCKNLFLRDDKGERHFLVVLAQSKRADLKSLARQLSCKSLGFASAKRLQRYLCLGPGEVTPLAILNDDERAVTVVWDSDLQGQAQLGIHPLDNRYTIWLSFDDLCQIIQAHGNTCCIAEI